MSLLETFKTRQAQENKERGDKELIGDAVAQIQELSLIESKKQEGKKWIMLKAEAIHPIADPKGRETTIEPGDEITTFYDPDNVDQAAKLQDDLFTAGISVDTSMVTNVKELVALLSEVAKNKLVYYRCYMAKKFKKEGDEFVAVEGEKTQRIRIKSKNLITDENSVPLLPF